MKRLLVAMLVLQTNIAQAQGPRGFFRTIRSASTQRPQMPRQSEKNMKRFLGASAVGSTAYALYGWYTTLPERNPPSSQEPRQMSCCEEAMLRDRGV